MKPAKDTTGSELVSPRAHVLMESLRATGYSLPDAIADLIDNSITAGAKSICLTFQWAGADSWMTLLDDGLGMTQDELVDAMRIGSSSPLEERTASDLGRYGLGLKTASISQARSLTVATKVSGERKISIRRWDLDHIAETEDWMLLRSATAEAMGFLSALREVPKGTMVIWEKLDRLVGAVKSSDAKARRQFHNAIRRVEEHVSMVFHRFMSAPDPVAIWLNRQRLTPWDPFLKDKAATQRLAVDRVGPPESSISVEPYVLPHHSRLTDEEHAQAGGPAGWNAQQGFYVYRSRRLLLAGDWLGLGYRKEEHYKLARILVDLPNTMDHEWQIDVRKSKASAPPALRDEFRRIARITRERAVTVYRHRGKTITRTKVAGPVFVWNRRVKNKKVSYVLNREHPLIKDMLRADSLEPGAIGRLLRLVEEYIPVQQIWVDSAGGDKTQAQPFESARSAELVAMIQMLYRAYLNAGSTHEEAMTRLASTEAFGERYELIESAIDDMQSKEDS